MQMLRSLAARFRRPLVLLVVAAVIGVLFVGLGLAQGPRAARAGATPASGSENAYQTGLEDSRKVAGFVEAYGQRIDEAEKRLASREDEVKELRERAKKLEALLVQVAGELTRRDENGTDPSGARDAGREREPAAPPPAALARLVRVTLADGAKDALARERGAAVHIPAGSFAEGTLLTGVFAPVEGGALPVQVKLDCIFTGPNRSRIPIQGAFLIGRAEGEANSTRVIIQLEKLSYVKPDGRAIEVRVNGYVADADGVQGLAGTYVWRIQETASIAALAGGIGAAAEALAQRETLTQVGPLGNATQVVTGDVGRFAAARGGSRAADAIERAFARRLDQIVPAIHVANGKKLTVVLLEGATLEGLTTNEVRHERDANPYAGLDLDR